MRLTKRERDYLRRIYNVTVLQGRAMTDYDPVTRLTLERKGLVGADGRLSPDGERLGKEPK